MKVTDAKFVNDFITMCDDCFKQGWHERNGGNMSYRIDSKDIDEIKDLLDFGGEWIDIGTKVSGVKGEFFLVTGTGKYFQNVKKNPEENIGITEINADGTKYRKVWGFAGGGRPTSEFPSHLINHEVKKEATGGANRVIYHCHPVNLIALTYVLPLEEISFTRELFETMPECSVVFPNGVGVLPYMTPGSVEIAKASGEEMKSHDVIVWAHHGIFCSGNDFDSAFGLAHTVEKAADIIVKIMSTRGSRLQTLTSDDFRALDKAYHLNIPEKYL